MFKNDIDEMIDLFFPSTIDWDKKAYKFNREEKDMHPYSIFTQKDRVIITHNILGINKSDIKLTLSTENNITYIHIEGNTTDNLTNQTYSISSRFALDKDELELTKISSKAENGLLYIIIPKKAALPKDKQQKLTINIQ